MVGIGPLSDECWLETPVRNPGIDDLAEMINTRQTKTLAAGIDQIMADLKDSINAPPREIGHHHTAIVLLWEYHRDPRPTSRAAHGSGTRSRTGPAFFHPRRRW